MSTTTVRTGSNGPMDAAKRPPIQEEVVVLDFGGQYSQLIARRVRECGVFSELLPHHVGVDEVRRRRPKGLILSGGPASVYADGAPRLDPELLELGIPVLGICYGMQALVLTAGGRVEGAEVGEFGRSRLTVSEHGRLLAGTPAVQSCWMSHRDTVYEAPPGFTPLASSTESPVAAVEDLERGLYGIQFHRAVVHQLTCVFVDHGLMRKNEGDQVIAAFRDHFKVPLVAVDAEDRFLQRLSGLSEPEAKRKAIGAEFIRVFEEEAAKIGDACYLVQGTLYSDVIESGGGTGAATIKSHHNVGGLPEDLEFELV